MSKKVYTLFLFIILGVFMISSISYASNNNFKVASIQKTTSSQKQQKECHKEDCCKKNDDSKNTEHRCDGKCNHSNCTTSILQFSLIAKNEIEFDHTIFNFSAKKAISHYKEVLISDGFTSIWSPPKIK